MPKATWNGVTLAESATTEVVEGNHYFPPASIDRSKFQASPTHSSCPWKGEASYYTVFADGKENKDAAKQIKDHVAFWKGVEVTP